MNFAYIINSVEGGGAALPVPAITKVIRDAGHTVTILALTRRDGRAITPMEKSGLTVVVRDGTKTDHLAAYKWLDQQIERLAPTHLWTSLTRATLLGQIVGRKRNLPVISWQHSARLKAGNAALLRLFRNRTALWIADSACVEAQTRTKIAPQNLIQWPIFRADPTTLEARPWQPGEPIRIGTLGRLHPVKGYDTLIEAIAQIRNAPPFTLTIAGEGEERTKLEALIAKYNAPVTLQGYTPNPQSFLQTLHLYTQTSHWEGLCLAAHEAMLAALPIVATQAGEIPYTVTPECGLIVPPKDARALAKAFETILRTPETLHEMGRNARARTLSRFNAETFDATGRQILETIKAL